MTADAIGTQDILLIKRPGRDSEESAITIKLKPTSRFTGRIVDQDGQPVAGQLVEVFSRGDATWLGPNTVEFPQGLLRSAADGSFQTPANLMVGLPYRVAVRATGKEPVLSDWITIGDKPLRLALDGTAALPDDSRTCGRPPGQAGREYRGLSIGRWARANGDSYRCRRAVFARRLSPGACVCVRARRGLSIPGPVGQGDRSERDARSDASERAARPRDENASRPDSARGVAGARAPAGRAAVGPTRTRRARQQPIRCLDLLGCRRSRAGFGDARRP